MLLNRRIAIRVDSSLSMGSGHVMRCMALASELKDRGGEVVFLCRELRGNMIPYIRELGHKVIVLNKTENGRPFDQAEEHDEWLSVNWASDARACLKHVREFGVDTVIVDSYSLNISWEAEMSEYVENIVSIDDLCRDHHCEMLIDQSLLRTSREYRDRIPHSSLALCGSHFAILRREFQENRKMALEKRKTTDSVRTIMISLGGADERNDTLKVLKHLYDSTVMKSVEKVLVILGAQCRNQTVIENYLNSYSFSFELHVASREMAKLMCQTDLAIGAPGVTSIERCCLGLPSLLYCVADNQKNNADALVRSGAGILCSLDSLVDLERGVCEVSGNYAVYSSAAASLCRGDGAARVSDMISTMGC
jgi:UDP-2,4-diacetamido-2,4,6-trideoxy-beta-L-altropyranose hydrolase